MRNQIQSDRYFVTRVWLSFCVTTRSAVLQLLSKHVTVEQCLKHRAVFHTRVSCTHTRHICPRIWYRQYIEEMLKTQKSVIGMIVMRYSWFAWNNNTHTRLYKWLVLLTIVFFFREETETLWRLPHSHHLYVKACNFFHSWFSIFGLLDVEVFYCFVDVCMYFFKGFWGCVQQLKDAPFSHSCGGEFWH